MSNEPPRIVQLTDLHIGRAGEDTFKVDVRGNFQKAIDAIKKIVPDILVISGDLCFQDGQPAIYQWIKNQLSGLPFPVYPLSGNHDETSLLAEAFGLQSCLRNGALYFEKVINGYHLLMLDTSKARCSNAQYNWLKNHLENPRGFPLIFMHHPPAVCGVPYMDENHAFAEMEKMQAVLGKFESVLPVFCGHYHVEKIIFKDNLAVHITPSTFFQIDENYRHFQVDHYRPAYRVIECEKKGIRTRVEYF